MPSLENRAGSFDTHISELQTPDAFISSKNYGPYLILQTLPASVLPEVYPIAAQRVNRKYSREKLRMKRDNQEPISEALSKHAIIPDSLERVRKTIKQQSIDGFLCKTVDQDTWFIGLLDKRTKLDPLSDPIVPNGIRKEFEMRQDRTRAVTGEDKAHEKNILLFLANWGKLSHLFYNQDIPSDKSLRRYREVDLNDYQLLFANGETQQDGKEKTCGKADFLGFGPDGRLIIVDFGGGKPHQLHKQALGIDSIFRDTQHEDSSIPVALFAGEYNHTGKIKTILLRPSRYSPHRYEKREEPIYPYTTP